MPDKKADVGLSGLVTGEKKQPSYWQRLVEGGRAIGDQVSVDPYSQPAEPVQGPPKPAPVPARPTFTEAQKRNWAQTVDYVEKNIVPIGDPYQGDRPPLERDLDALGYDPLTITQSILSEPLKIGGFKFDEPTGTWDWNPANVPQYFKDDPVWATIDAASLAAAPLKAGLGAAKLAAGATTAGRALRAGEFGTGVKAAAKAFKVQQRNAVPTTRFGRYFSNPVTQRFDDDYVSLMEKYGATPTEAQAMGDMARRDFILEQAQWGRMNEELVRKLAKAGITDPDQQKRFTRLLESGVPPDASTAEGRFLDSLLTRTEQEAYQATWNFRQMLGDEAFDLDMISVERYMDQMKWTPHRRQVFQDALARRGVKATSATPASFQSFKKRQLSREQYESLYDRVFDPTVTAVEMGKAAQGLVRVRYAKRLAESSVSRGPDELFDHLTNKVLADDKLRKLWGIDMATAVDLQRAINNAPRGADGKVIEEAAAEIANRAGWVRLGDVHPSLNIPHELADRFVDKKVAKDIGGALHISDPNGADFLGNVYDKTIKYFQAAKTSYNPSTHVRNTLGALVFHHLTVGGFGAFSRKGLGRGIDLMRNGLDGADPVLRRRYARALKDGVVGSSWDNELKSEYVRALGSARPSTALDFLGDSKFAKTLQAGAGGMERFYRGTDELFKLDAWSRLVERFEKKYAGKGWSKAELEERASQWASSEVNRYMPSFTMHSPFGDAVRSKIPFSSFGVEATRVWKNAMQNKPHLVMFWNHQAEMMSDAFGAMAGLSQEEVDSATQDLPYYQHGKKMLWLPFRVHNKPVAVDLSYLIPMANIGESQREGAIFADQIPIDPFTNPLLSTAAATFIGVDPFRKQPVEPRATERFLGVTADDPNARHAIGLAEHIAGTMAPPWLPPGYAGINMLEWATGQKHPDTGAELEEGFVRTFATNILGMRLHEADVHSQLLNEGARERRIQDRVSDWWTRWEWASANDDKALLARAEENLIQLQLQRGKSPEAAQAYLEKGRHEHEVGKFRTLPKDRLARVRERSKAIGLDRPGGDPDDARMLQAIEERLAPKPRKPRKPRQKKGEK